MCTYGIMVISYDQLAKQVLDAILKRMLGNSKNLTIAGLYTDSAAVCVVEPDKQELTYSKKRSRQIFDMVETK